LFAGKGPLYMQTAEAIQKIAASAGDEKAAKKKLKHLEAEAWEDFLDMTVSQAILWAAMNIEPEKVPSEIAPCEPYFIGSHSGASGAWVSGPEDLQLPGTKKDYFWGYTNMTTVPGMFAAGDASGASSHKFSTGSFTEGRIAAKAAIKYCVENTARPNVSDATIADYKKRTLAPIDLYDAHKNYSSDENINPNFIKPRDYMFRLQKLMDEYAGGVSAQFTTNEHLLNRGLELLTMLKEDSAKLAAGSLNELMRCWENLHRTSQAEAHVRTLLFRQETRWPGYYYRADKPNMDETNWKCFVNCRCDPKTGEWTLAKRPIHRIVE
jgi:adenylylsulfate reductase subunit A